jgi:hypothetical protein
MRNPDFKQKDMNVKEGVWRIQTGGEGVKGSLQGKYSKYD